MFSQSFLFFWKNRSVLWVARVARHPHATRVGETPGAQRATGSAHWPLGVWWTGGSADALVGALEGIGWQQVRQGGLETYLFCFSFVCVL